MLFMTFLGLNVHKMKLHPSHFVITALNILIGVVSCEIFKLTGNMSLAAAAFFTGIAPTATAAPAIASFLRRDVEYIVTGMLTTTAAVSIALPCLIPWAVGMDATASAFFDAFLHALGTVASTIVAPIAAARLLRRVYPSSQTWTKRFKSLTFYAWVLMVTVLACRASNFIHDPRNGVGAFVIVEALTLSLAICATNFIVGYFVGEKGFREEASQTLGQKNTGAMIYFAVLYGDPLAALGPTLYVLWHNTWNATQLQWQAMKDARARSYGKRAATVDNSGFAPVALALDAAEDK